MAVGFGRGGAARAAVFGNRAGRFAVLCAVLTGSALFAVGCGGDSETEVGDCGFFSGDRISTFQGRACADPEAALVVVRASSKNRCADPDYSASSGARAKKGRSYLCTQLNAQVGDCFNNPDNKSVDLDRLRKVPCSTAGAYQVNTKVARHDPKVCSAVRSQHSTTTFIAHEQPAVSFCLHRVGT